MACYLLFFEGRPRCLFLELTRWSKPRWTQIVGLTRSLAAKISANEEKITVNCLCPGKSPFILSTGDLDFLLFRVVLTPVSCPRTTPLNLTLAPCYVLALTLSTHLPPGLVPTGLTAPLIAICPAEYITPTSTVVRAVQQFLDDDTLTGQVAECSGEAIHHRSQPEWGDDMAEYVMGPGLRALMKASRVKIEEDK